MDKGKIDPNLRICDGEPQQQRDLDWHPMDYSKAFSVYNDRCRGEIDAEINILNVKTACRANLQVKNICGGGCPYNVKGGKGEAKPVYNTTILLSNVPQGSTRWVIDFQLLGQNNTGVVNGQYEIILSVGGQDYKFTYDMDNINHKFAIPSIAPGIYDLTVSFPHVERGCQGKPQGTIVFSEFNTSFITDIYSK